MRDLVISAAEVDGRIIPPQDHATRPLSVRRISFGKTVTHGAGGLARRNSDTKCVAYEGANK